MSRGRASSPALPIPAAVLTEGREGGGASGAGCRLCCSCAAGKCFISNNHLSHYLAVLALRYLVTAWLGDTCSVSKHFREKPSKAVNRRRKAACFHGNVLCRALSITSCSPHCRSAGRCWKSWGGDHPCCHFWGTASLGGCMAEQDAGGCPWRGRDRTGQLCPEPTETLSIRDGKVRGSSSLWAAEVVFWGRIFQLCALHLF